MRVQHVLWLLIATFASRCIIISTASTPNTIQPGASVSKEIAGNRFLRGSQETNNDGGEAAADDEERIIAQIRKTLGLYDAKLQTSIFDKMIADDVFKAEMFAKWDKFDVSIKRIKKSMKPTTNTGYEAMFNEYAIRWLLRKKKFTADNLMREMKASFPYKYADEATKNAMVEVMVKNIGAALRSI